VPFEDQQTRSQSRVCRLRESLNPAVIPSHLGAAA
jgi:hypothetical protein